MGQGGMGLNPASWKTHLLCPALWDTGMTQSGHIILSLWRGIPLLPSPTVEPLALPAMTTASSCGDRVAVPTPTVSGSPRPGRQDSCVYKAVTVYTSLSKLETDFQTTARSHGYSSRSAMWGSQTPSASKEKSVHISSVSFRCTFMYTLVHAFIHKHTCTDM